MEQNTGAIVRESIQSAIDNVVKYKGKDYPYDKTYLGRIISANTNKTYNIIINGKTYNNIKAVNLFDYAVNDIVICLAPQANLNQLMIYLSLSKIANLKINNIELNNLSSDSITSSSGSITDLNVEDLIVTNGNFINGNFTTSLKLNNKNVESIIESNLIGTSIGYIKYSSGLTIQWGTFMMTGTATSSEQEGNKGTFPISFTSNTSYIVSGTTEGVGLNAPYNNTTQIFSRYAGYFYIVKNFGETDRKFSWMAIGY